MARSTYSRLRGIAVLESAWKPTNLTTNDAGATATGSDYTESQPKPGRAVADQANAIALPVVRNAQPNDLELRTVSAGAPAGWAYRDAGETDAQYRGAGEGWQVTLLSSAVFFSASTTTSGYSLAAKPKTGTLLLAYYDSDAVEGRVTRYSPATRTWGSTVTVDDSATPGLNNPGIMYFSDTDTWVVFNCGGSGFANNTAWFSTDDGATWSEYAFDIYANTASPLGTVPINPVVDRLGNPVFVESDGSGTAYWYRSEDRGASFTRYANQTTTYWNGRLARFADGSLLFVYHEDPSVAAVVKAKVLADGYVDPGSVAGVSVDPSNPQCFNGETIWCWVDAEDVAWVSWANIDSAPAGPEQRRIARSLDRGATWEEIDHRMMEMTSNAASAYLTRFAAEVSGGEVVVCCTYVGDREFLNQIWTVHLAGWSNVELGGLAVGVSRINRRSFARDSGTGTAPSYLWWLLEPPETSGWTATLTGSVTEDNTVNGRQIVSTAGNAKHYGVTLGASTRAEAVYYAQVVVESGGDLTDDDVSMLVSRRDGTNSSDIAIRMSTTGFAVYDVGAAADLATVTRTMTGATQLLMCWSAINALAVFYKGPGDELWSVAYSGLIAQGSTAADEDLVEWGHRAATASSSSWMCIGVSDGAFAHHSLTAGSGYQPLRYGAPLRSSGRPARDLIDGDGLMSWLGTSGAFARVGRTYSVATQAVGRAENMFPTVEASPRVLWTGTDETQHDFVVELAGGEFTRPGPSWALLFMVQNAGFRTVELARGTGAGAFTTLGTLDLATGFAGLSFSVNGYHVSPAAGVEGSRFVAGSELVGGFVRSDTGVCSRIADNTPGYWTASGEHQPLQLILEDTGFTGTTLDIVWPSGVLVVPQTGASLWAYARARIPAQDAPGGALSCGDMFLGALVVPGKQWDRGLVTELEPNVAVRDDIEGGRRVFERGPPRRRISVAWNDGHDVTSVRVHEGANYLAPSASAAPVSTINNVRFEVERLFRYAKGGQLPVVVLLDEMPATATTFTDPSVFLSGWLEGSASSEQVTGDEGSSEVFRTQSISITERL